MFTEEAFILGECCCCHQSINPFWADEDYVVVDGNLWHNGCCRLWKREDVPEEECPGCGNNRKLETHHWYNKEGILFTKKICRECNEELIWLVARFSCKYANHYLPPWEAQLEFLRKNYKRFYSMVA